MQKAHGKRTEESIQKWAEVNKDMKYNHELESDRIWVEEEKNFAEIFRKEAQKYGVKCLVISSNAKKDVKKLIIKGLTEKGLYNMEERLLFVRKGLKESGYPYRLLVKDENTKGRSQESMLSEINRIEEQIGDFWSHMYLELSIAEEKLGIEKIFKFLRHKEKINPADPNAEKLMREIVLKNAYKGTWTKIQGEFGLESLEKEMSNFIAGGQFFQEEIGNIKEALKEHSEVALMEVVESGTSDRHTIGWLFTKGSEGKIDAFCLDSLGTGTIYPLRDSQLLTLLPKDPNFNVHAPLEKLQHGYKGCLAYASTLPFKLLHGIRSGKIDSEALGSEDFGSTRPGVKLFKWPPVLIKYLQSIKYFEGKETMDVSPRKNNAEDAKDFIGKNTYYQKEGERLQNFAISNRMAKLVEQIEKDENLYSSDEEELREERGATCGAKTKEPAKIKHSKSWSELEKLARTKGTPENTRRNGRGCSY